MPKGKQTKRQAKRNLKSAQKFIGSLYESGVSGVSPLKADLNLVQKNKEVLKGLKSARKTSGSIKRKSIRGKKLSVGVDVRYNPSPTGSRTTEDVGGFRVRRTKIKKSGNKQFGKEFVRVNEGTGPDRYLKKNLKTGKIKDVSRRKFMKTLDKVTKGGGRTRTRKNALGEKKMGPSPNNIYVGKDYSVKNKLPGGQRLERPALGDETQGQAFGFGGRKAFRETIKKQKGVIKSQKIAIKQKTKGQHESQKQFLPMDAYRFRDEVMNSKRDPFNVKMQKPKMLRNKRKNHV